MFKFLSFLKKGHGLMGFDTDYSITVRLKTLFARLLVLVSRYLDSIYHFNRMTRDIVTLVRRLHKCIITFYECVYNAGLIESANCTLTI